eukprot:4258478-Alexandrium_andersonii.AAC.1
MPYVRMPPVLIAAHEVVNITSMLLEPLGPTAQQEEVLLTGWHVGRLLSSVPVPLPAQTRGADHASLAH